ncbi:MAG TPA: hypothetical protein VK306_08905 [Acidimicrobiales bacterium]|nr:hypothetical protein [Acidimicrobiales bacterium]
MSERSARIEQFTSSVADMKLRDPATGVDRVLTRLGLAGLVAGVACAAAAWFISHGTRNPLQQRDAIVLGLLGVTLAIVGGVLWLKATLAGFLRFWMARFVYEQQAQADRLAAAVTAEVPPPSAVGAAAAPAPAEDVEPAPPTSAPTGGRADVVNT